MEILDKDMFNKLNKLIDLTYKHKELLALYKKANKEEKYLKKTKEELIIWFINTICNKELFYKLYNNFTINEKFVLNYLLFSYYKLTMDELLDVIKKNNNRMYFLNQNYEYFLKGLNYEFAFFSEKDDRIILLKEIRDIIIEHFDIPNENKLVSVQNLEKTDFSYNNKSFILNNLKKYFKFLHYSSFKNKINKLLLKKEADDFYNYCEFNYINNSQDTKKQLDLFIKFLQLYSSDEILKNYNNIKPQNIIKELSTNFFNDIDKSDNNIIENHIIFDYLVKKKNSYFKTFYLYKQEFLKILKLIYKKNWVEFENLIDSLSVNKIEVDPPGLSYYTFDNYSVIKDNFINYNFEYKKNKHYIINLPIFYSYFLIFTMLGCIESKYNNVSNNNHFLNRGFSTIFDNLKYVKLTELGEYIIGKKTNYEYADKIDEETEEISLSPDVLVATTDQKNSISKIVLREFGEQMGENSFRFNYEYFFKNSKSCKELSNKYNKLLLLLNKYKIPVIWSEFLTNLKNRIMEAKFYNIMNIYELPDNKEFLRFLTTNQEIKDLILKVEKNKFAIKSSNIPLFKEIISKNGFWLEFDLLMFDDLLHLDI